MKYLIAFLFVACISCKEDFTRKQSVVGIDGATALTINVKDYGATGNGSTDDVNAFQAAEDYLAARGGGTLYVPAGIYIVSGPFYHRSFVTLTGDGDVSIIKNKNSYLAGKDDNFCIFIGSFKPDTYVKCVHYDVEDAVAGVSQVKLKSGVISDFFPGQAVLIDSKAGFVTTEGDNHWKPYYAFINRVTAVSEDGVISLEDALTTSFSGAQIAPTNKFTTDIDTNQYYICQRPVIQNIRFESNGDWTLRFGVHKGLFQNLSLRTTDVIRGNGFSWCTFKNIRAEFSQKVIEMAMYSHNSTVEKVTATWFNEMQYVYDMKIVSDG
jgi:hypothetical protein